MDEICRSNIMQRDNKQFARKLDKSLVKLAKERSKTVSRGGASSQEKAACSTLQWVFYKLN